jgi:hypothetical protein
MKSMSRHEQHEKHGEREADSDGGIDTPTRRTGTAMPDRRAMAQPVQNPSNQPTDTPVTTPQPEEESLRRT